MSYATADQRVGGQGPAEGDGDRDGSSARVPQAKGCAADRVVAQQPKVAASARMAALQARARARIQGVDGQ